MRVGRSAAVSPNPSPSATPPYANREQDVPPVLDQKPLLEKNLHRLKVKGYRIGSEEIVADHAGKAEAKCVFPRERAIVETRDVVFL